MSPSTNDPTDPSFTLDGWETDLRRDRRQRLEEQGRRDAAWREEARTRLRDKNGPSGAPSYVSVPVPNPAPGAPRFVLVHDRRSGS